LPVEGVALEDQDPNEDDEGGEDEILKIKNGDADDEVFKKNKSIQFFMSLLSAIYNSEPPRLSIEARRAKYCLISVKPADPKSSTVESGQDLPKSSATPLESGSGAPNSKKQKERKRAGESDSVHAVREFLTKAKDFLSLENGHAASYPSTSVLQSTATNLTVEYMKHYKHGSIELCKKIRTLKKKGVLPLDTVDNIDLRLSAVENFIILNRILGSRRCLTPMSPMDSTFVNLSELDLTKLFWHDTALKRQLQ
ncbi:hypothetical protein EDD11_000480, partial [Mortierella claussenii]